MRDSIRHFLAEFIGVFGLVFVGGATILATRGTDGLVAIALAHGLTLGILITATMRVSGHLNPAVTLGFLVTRRIEPMMAGIYLVAQILGGLIAAYALKGLFPAVMTAGGTALGGQAVSIDITFAQAFALESIATFFLVFVVFATAVDPNAPKVGGFAIGLTLTVAILAIGSLTGASLNPARSFGPAVATARFEAQVIYWAAPIVGGMIAALIYDRVFLPRAPEPHAHGAVRPESTPAPRVHGV